jgi:adenylosuccinate synthase
MMNVDIIVGCGFGDEGKGTFVNYRVKQVTKPLVVRFCGGHQVGHTVVENGIRHAFSNFGSGTLAGAPTYWSEYCTLNPLAVKKEGDVLRAQGIEPQLIINANAMITTPYDIYRNMNDDKNKLHGTVGVGFGATIQRNEDMYHLYARDLQYPKIRDAKLIAIQQYVCITTNDYGIVGNTYMDKLLNEFRAACDELVERFIIVDNLNNLLDRDLIFEGGQGIMLDMDYGFFPNVTRSNTTSKNAIAILDAHNLRSRSINTYYVTRAYATRHGNGFLPNEGLDISFIKENPLETNVMGTQGEFRKAVLDLDMIKYAVECDKYHNPVTRRGMVITCLDQLERPDAIPVTIEGKPTTVRFNQIGKNAGINFKYPCFADTGFDSTVDFNGNI